MAQEAGYLGCAARGGREPLVPRKAELASGAPTGTPCLFGLLCRARRGQTCPSAVSGSASGSGAPVTAVGFPAAGGSRPRGWRFSHGQGCPELCGCGHWEPELLPQECGLSASRASRPSSAF